MLANVEKAEGEHTIIITIIKPSRGRRQCQRSRNVGFRTQTVPDVDTPRILDSTLSLPFFSSSVIIHVCIYSNPPLIINTLLKNRTRPTEEIEKHHNHIIILYVLQLSAAGSPGINFFLPKGHRLRGRKNKTVKKKKITISDSRACTYSYIMRLKRDNF